MKYFVFLLLSLVFLFTSCKKLPETLVAGGYDQAAMDRAIARARVETDQFIKIMTRREGDSFSVKAPVSDGEDVEHFWIIDLVYQDGYFTGKIGNDPGLVSNVQFGQEWKIKKEEISDWMFTRGDKIHGCYTVDPLLPEMPEKEAAEMRARLVR